MKRLYVYYKISTPLFQTTTPAAMSEQQDETTASLWVDLTGSAEELAKAIELWSDFAIRVDTVLEAALAKQETA